MSNKKQIKDFNLLSHVIGGQDNLLVQRDNGTTFRIHINSLPFTNKDYSTAGLASINYVDNQDNGLQIQINYLNSSSGRIENNLNNYLLKSNYKNYTTAGLATISYVSIQDTVLQAEINILESTAGYLENKINDLEIVVNSLESTAGRLENDINNLTLDWDKITNTPSTIEGYNLHLETIDITYQDLLAKQSTNGLTPLVFYNIIDSVMGGEIVLQAITTSILDEKNAIWNRNSNLTSFGFVTFSPDIQSGSIDSITINGIELLSAPMDTTISIGNLLEYVANDILTNTSYKSYAANNCLVIISQGNEDGAFLTASATGFVVEESSTMGGYKPNFPMSLKIEYSLLSDMITKAYDSYRDVELVDNYYLNYIKDFRWGDDGITAIKNSVVTNVYYNNNPYISSVSNITNSYIGNLFLNYSFVGGIHENSSVISSYLKTIGDDSCQISELRNSNCNYCTLLGTRFYNLTSVNLLYGNLVTSNIHDITAYSLGTYLKGTDMSTTTAPLKTDLEITDVTSSMGYFSYLDISKLSDGDIFQNYYISDSYTVVYKYVKTEFSNTTNNGAIGTIKIPFTYPYNAGFVSRCIVQASGLTTGSSRAIAIGTVDAPSSILAATQTSTLNTSVFTASPLIGGSITNTSELIFTISGGAITSGTIGIFIEIQKRLF